MKKSGFPYEMAVDPNRHIITFKIDSDPTACWRACCLGGDGLLYLTLYAVDWNEAKNELNKILDSMVMKVPYAFEESKYEKLKKESGGFGLLVWLLILPVIWLTRKLYNS